MGDPNAAKVEEATRGFIQFAAVLNDHLRGRKYLVADRLTIADFSVAITLPYAAEAHLPLDGFPEIARCMRGSPNSRPGASRFPPWPPPRRDPRRRRNARTVEITMQQHKIVS